MSGQKTLVNKTGQYMNGVLDVRKGSNPQAHLRDVKFSLEPGESTTIQYGDDQNPFLNGVRYEYKPEGSLVGFSASVATRGSSWDDVFNTNSTLTFHDISPSASISGSN